MPDISMCLNATCPLRVRCYRHQDSGTRPSEHRQAYSPDFKPDENGNCRYFWDTGKASVEQ